MPNYEYIRTDNFLDLPTNTTMSSNEQHQPKSMNDEYNEIRKECIQRSFKSTQSSSIKSSATSSNNATNVQSQILMGSSNNNTTQRRRRSIDDNITNNHSSTNNNRLKQNHRRHSISNSTPNINNSFVNSSQISNILQEHLLHSAVGTLDDSNDTNQHKQKSSDVYNTTPQTVHDAINLELQNRNNRRDSNIKQNRNKRDSSTSPLPPTSELQRHLQRSSTTSNQSSSVSQRRGNRQAGSNRHTSGGSSLRDSNATILHSNQKRTNQGGLRDSSVTILHSNQQRKETQNSNQLGNNGSRPKELVDSLQYSLDDSGKSYDVFVMHMI